MIGVYSAFNMYDIGIGEVTDYLTDGIGLANVGEKLVAKTFSLICTFHQTGNIYKLNGSGNNTSRVNDVGKLL